MMTSIYLIVAVGGLIALLWLFMELIRSYQPEQGEEEEPSDQEGKEWYYCNVCRKRTAPAKHWGPMMITPDAYIGGITPRKVSGTDRWAVPIWLAKQRRFKYSACKCGRMYRKATRAGGQR